MFMCLGGAKKGILWSLFTCTYTVSLAVKIFGKEMCNVLFVANVDWKPKSSRSSHRMVMSKRIWRSWHRLVKKITWLGLWHACEITMWLGNWEHDHVVQMELFAWTRAMHMLNLSENIIYLHVVLWVVYIIRVRNQYCPVLNTNTNPFCLPTSSHDGLEW